KHSIEFFPTVSDGVTNLPEFVAVAQIDDIEVGHCDSNTKTLEAKQTWLKRLLDENPEHLQWYSEWCFESLPLYRSRIKHIQQSVHILQLMSGCEWDDETGKVNGFLQYGYDGEDYISFDLETLTWVAAKPQAVVTKQSWDADRGRIKDNENFFTQTCPEWLKMYLNYGKNFLLRTVCLLQKTPSSPVSCHATGFYPHRALLFWTKDGEELHEDRSPVTPASPSSLHWFLWLSSSLLSLDSWFIKRRKKREEYEMKHSLKFFSTVSDGVTNLPKAVLVELVNDIQTGHCDSNINRVELKQTWMKTVFDENPANLRWHTGHCFDTPNFFKASIQSLKQRFNQSGGVHIFQRFGGCEWDDETGEVTGFQQFGYNGEDFISLDMKTETWIAAKPQAVVTKLKWDADRGRIKENEYFFTKTCPEWLKMYLKYGRSSVLRTVPPSMSLLQKTPSSPVSCHATGFYPHRAVVFWTKDGEELHEDVDQGEILPNHDGTFQMTTDLDVSSVKAEDWRRYDCVFQRSGVKDDIVTKLDKAQIRTNMEKPSNTSVPIISALVPLALVLIAVAGFLVYKQKKESRVTFCILQRLGGCEWDDDTGEVTGFNQFAYDGEDFLSLDLKTETWIAAEPQTIETHHEVFSTVSDGVTNLPEAVIVELVNGVQTGHCDSNINRVELKQTWMKTVFDEHPEHLQWHTGHCFDTPNFFKASLQSLKLRFNQSGGVHIFQRFGGCEWDDETGEVTGFQQYGYNGEDFISLDMKTETWIAAKPQAVVTKLKWDADRGRIKENEYFFTKMCPEWLKMYLNYGRSSVLRTDLPSVSLLQKTPSSPVSCHATGFYPHRALVFWTKDGEELHEDVDQGEILPNHDGTFQMTVDLDVSSVKAEDWRRYDCVFQLYGVKDDIVTKLDKTLIRTNMGKSDIIRS
ncbi:hypothetical protein INR49_019104, partial [Caranx melampygus]